MIRNISHFLYVLTCVIGYSSFASDANARNVYLNGIDISGVQSQELESVNIHINEKGDIFIIAPQYNVNEENTYLPLSQHRSKNQKNKMVHKPPRQISDGMIAQPIMENMPEIEADNRNNADNLKPATITEKPGSKEVSPQQ